MGQKLSKPQLDELLVEDLAGDAKWADSIDLLRRCAAAVDAGKMPLSALDEVRDIVDQQLIDDECEKPGEGHSALRLLPMEITFLP